MSTRGCIIELKKDVCKVGYLHYGANFASKLIHYGMAIAREIRISKGAYTVTT